MLHQIVCVKQVPGTNKVAVDPVTGVLLREGVASKMNPYDLYALETAFQIRSQHGGTVTALSMGPAQAKTVLLEALCMGADAAVLLCDRRFAGADVLATSYTLSQAILLLRPFDLVICGRQTTDGDTAQVGAELAEWLDIPHAGPVARLLELSSVGADASLTAELSLENLIQTVRLRLPCLISVEKDITTPRLPSYRRKLALGDDPVRILTLDDLPDRFEQSYGLSGSPTQVEQIFPPEHSESHSVHREDDVALADIFYQLLWTQKRLEDVGP